jgi:hypothetical protein
LSKQERRQIWQEDKKSVPKRKKYYKKEKNAQAYFVEWDSDASSDEDDDDKPSRGLGRVAIKEAPSLFSKPYCLMAKGESKVIIDCHTRFPKQTKCYLYVCQDLVPYI